jgi:hypothetical protein
MEEYTGEDANKEGENSAMARRIFRPHQSAGERVAIHAVRPPTT